MKGYIDGGSKKYFAFNVWSIDSAIPVIDAAAEGERDVILQTSPKSFAGLDKDMFRFLVKAYGEKRGIHVYLHLDHCGSMDMIKEAIYYGWDSVMADASDKTIEENIEMTRLVIEKAHPSGVLVESEVGRIVGAEEDRQVSEGGIADIRDIRRMLEETELDMLAAAVGTAHGSYKGKPEIRYGLLDEIQNMSDIPLVIHGGSGLGITDMRRLLLCRNVKKINISTEIKQAYLRCLPREGEQREVWNISSDISRQIRRAAWERLTLL